MSFIKRAITLSCAACLAAFAAAALSGCGDAVAATWAHGKILEEDVTTSASSDMSSYLNSDYTTYDVEGWSSFIANREYEEDSTATTTTDESSATDATAETATAATEQASDGDGTVEEYREYLIEKLVRQDMIEWAIKDSGVKVSDSEIEERVDEEAVMYEAYYGGGYAGTFESILTNYMGMDMDTFKGYVEEELLQEKWEMKICDVDSADDIDSDKVDEYVDGLMEDADINVKSCPKDLTYDPANMESSSSSSDTSSSTSTDTTETSDSTNQQSTDAKTEDESSEASSK